MCTLHGASVGQKSKGTPKPGDGLQRLKLQSWQAFHELQNPTGEGQGPH